MFELFSELGLQHTLNHIDNPSFLERCNAFDCFPSTGSLAMYGAKTSNKKLFVCGFSFYTINISTIRKNQDYGNHMVRVIKIYSEVLDILKKFLNLEI